MMKKLNIKKGLSDIFYIWRKEFIKIFKDEGIIIFFIVVPLLYPLLYTEIYSPEIRSDIPLAYVDNSNSKLSREFIRKLDATQEVKVIGRCNDVKEAIELQKEHKAFAYIYIPYDFNKKISKGEQAHIGLYSKMGLLLNYKGLSSACANVVKNMNNNIIISNSNTTTDRQAQLSSNPVSYRYISIFNKNAGFASFIMPAVLMLIIQQTLILGIGMGIGTERENNRFKSFIPLNSRYHGIFRNILGKSLCYLPIYMCMSFYVLGIIPRIFNLNAIGDPLSISLFMLPYLLACIFFSMTFGLLVAKREDAMAIFISASVPLLFMSGISWPGAAVPKVWEYFSYIFPSTFGINGFCRMQNTGALLNNVRFEYLALWIQTIVYFVVLCAIYKYRLTKNKRLFLVEKRKSV